MTDREKLVELLTAYYGADPAYYDVDAPSIADHLLANGVVVREWIPVTERLPEVGRRVLVTDGKHVSFGYDLRGGEGNLWCAQFPCNDGEVTHWMPLPEPPADMRKGENGGV